MAEKKKVTGGKIGDRLVGFQFTNKSALFTNATFDILPGPLTYVENGRVGDEYESYTLEDLQTETTPDKDLYTEHLKTGDLRDYVYFGSLEKRLAAAVSIIMGEFPGSVFVHPGASNSPTVTSFTVSAEEGQFIQTFTVPLERMINKTSEIFPFSEQEIVRSTGDYEFFCDEKYYTILSASLEAGGLVLQVAGKPIVNNLQIFHIVYNRQLSGKVIFNLGGVEQYMLNSHTAKGYNFFFRFEEDGRVTDKHFLWPAIDGFNPDIRTREFYNFAENLIQFGRQYDVKKGNILLQYLPEFKGEEEVLSVYNDIVSRFIDELTYLGKASLTKKDKIHNPHSLLEEFSNQGWEGVHYLDRFLGDFQGTDQFIFVNLLNQYCGYLKQWKASGRILEELLNISGFSGICEVKEIIQQENVEIKDNRKSWVAGLSEHIDPVYNTSYTTNTFQNSKKFYLNYLEDGPAAALLAVNTGISDGEVRKFLRKQFILLHEGLFPFISVNFLPASTDLVNSLLKYFKAVNKGNGTATLSWETDNRFFESIEIQRSTTHGFTDAATVTLPVAGTSYTDTLPDGYKIIYYRMRGLLINGRHHEWVYQEINKI